MNSMCRGPGERGFLQGRGRACETKAKEEGPVLAARA